MINIFSPLGNDYALLQQRLTYLDNNGRIIIFDQLKSQNRVCDDQKANIILNRIMRNLSSVALEHDTSLKDKPYYFFVNQNEIPNAFCSLGHNITVNIGLFKSLDYNEDEIAFVVGHELAHGTFNDPINTILKKMALDSAFFLTLSTNSENQLLIGAKIASLVGTAKGITIPQEKKADEEAFYYCSKSGYNIGAGAALWQRIIDISEKQDKLSNKLPEFLHPADHPDNIHRRNMFVNKIYEYSNKIVFVDANTGNIYINNRLVGTPIATENKTSKERALLIAGKLAGIFHNNKNYHSYIKDNILFLNNTPIINGILGDDLYAWVKHINSILVILNAQQEILDFRK